MAVRTDLLQEPRVDGAQDTSRAGGDVLVDDDALTLDTQLCFALYAASRAMIDGYRPALSKLGLTYPQYLVMLVLWERDGITVGEVGSRLLLDTGTVTPLLRRLDERGFVERRRNPDDERQVIVTLTEKGRTTRSAAVCIPTEVASTIPWSPSRAEALRSELKQLIDQLT